LLALKLSFVLFYFLCYKTGKSVLARYGSALDDRSLARKINLALISIFLIFVALAAFIRLVFDIELLLPQIIRIHATHFKWFGVELMFSGMAGFAAGLYSSEPAALRRRLYITVAVLFALFAYFENFYTRPIYALCKDQLKDGFIVQTFQSTCGPSSLANLFILNGKKISESEAARAARTRYTGTTGDELALAAAALDKEFYAHYFKLKFDDIEKLGLPCVLSFGEEHFVTYIGKQKHLCEYVDPSIGICLSKRDELIKQWDGKALFIYRKDFSFELKKGETDPRVIEIKKSLAKIDGNKVLPEGSAAGNAAYDGLYGDTLEARLASFITENKAEGKGASNINPFVNLLIFSKAGKTVNSAQ